MGLIELRNVSKSYGAQPVLREFSLRIEPGSRTVLLGPSGCGKTTLLRLLAGFLAPDAGSILLEDQLVAENGRNLREPERRNLGMVFQDLALWPHLSVRGNLEFGLEARGLSQRERGDRIREVLSRVRMEKFEHARPADLSGGQQQRVALARALVLRPRILLMDEPLSNLDFELNFKIRKEILRLQQQVGFTLVFVTHDLEEAFGIGDFLVVIEGGRIKQAGPVSAIKNYFSKLEAQLGE